MPPARTQCLRSRFLVLRESKDDWSETGKRCDRSTSVNSFAAPATVGKVAIQMQPPGCITTGALHPGKVIRAA